jgi:tetratricopeptide (TPR) repeat protein
MGYELLRSGMKEQALSIFKLNVEQFPDSWNVYDSYGEALLAMGRKDEAIENYKKSVEMNPGNTSGINALKEQGVAIEDLVKEVVVDDAVLASYVGKYELQPGFILSITKEGSQLSGQATGQGANPIFPKSENEFYLKVVAAELVFHKNDAGQVDSLTLKQGGQEMKAKKIE